MYQRYDPAVFDGLAQQLYQFAVADSVKELLKVKVYAAFIAAIDDFLRFLHGLVRAPSRAEAVARIRELRLIHQAQYLGYGLLDDAVHYGGDAELSRLSSFFGYLYPPCWVGAVASAEQTFCQFILVFTQVGKQLVHLHSVDSTTPLVGLDLSVRSVEVVGSEHVFQHPV